MPSLPFFFAAQFFSAPMCNSERSRGKASPTYPPNNSRYNDSKRVVKALAGRFPGL